MRFDYDPPTPVLIIANGLSLLYYDEELKKATFLPLWKTPLWFLIREEVRFDDNVEIVAIEEARGTLRIPLRDPDALEGGAVTLIVAEAQNRKSVVARRILQVRVAIAVLSILTTNTR